jgi:hypothetical protein
VSKKIKISDLIPDDKNFNKHTQKGMGLLETSIGKVGVIESITVSSDDKIISGNARHEVMGRKFEGVEPIIIETDGTRPVILKRTDIKGNTKRFYEASILANTVGKHNLALDLDLIESVAVQEYEIDVEGLGVSLPKEEEEDYGGGSGKEEYTLIITISDKIEANAVLSEMEERGFAVFMKTE